MGLEVPLWRALVVFRVAALGYAAVLMVGNFQQYHWPTGGWLIIAVMAIWTVVTSLGYAKPERRDWPMLTADLLVTAGCLLASRWIVRPEGLGLGSPSLPMAWVAAPVVAWAISGGRRRGAIAAVLMGIADTVVRDGLSQGTVNGAVLMLLAGVIIGHIARLTMDAESRLQQAVELEAVTRERERLARGIHDSVLQVLALVQRRGAELGGEAAELGRLAGEQEATLRALVSARLGDPPGEEHPGSDAGHPGERTGSGIRRRRSLVTRTRGGRYVAAAPARPTTGSSARPAGRPAGTNPAGDRRLDVVSELVDLRTVLEPHTVTTGATVAAPATPVWLPVAVAAEIAGAVAAALDNVRVHAGPTARAWLLLEELDDAVVVTVRDDGQGMPDGRLTDAESAGRLGVAQSIRGRVRDLGGTVTVTSSPGQGTEIELRVPR